MSLPRELALTGVAVLLLLFCIDGLLNPNYELRNFRIFSEMVDSKAQESFGPSAVLAGGTTQQALVDGVVMRGELPFAYGDGAEEAQRAGRELSNPFAAVAGDELQRGRQVFTAFCSSCHGVDGMGRGPVVARGMLPPPSLLAARAMSMPDGELFHVITRGQGNMKSHAAQVVASDRWKAILWIRSLQEGDQ